VNATSASISQTEHYLRLKVVATPAALRRWGGAVNSGLCSLQDLIAKYKVEYPQTNENAAM
jgi:hypothetical protein